MNRRDALQAAAAILGTTIIGSDIFLVGCNSPKGKIELDASAIELLNDMAETIIPTTPDSPGAGASHVGEFILDIIKDCYSDAERKVFEEGLSMVPRLSKEKFGADFLSLPANEKHDFISSLDKEAKQVDGSKSPPHFFTMIKQLTIWGYFTSEPGATMALRYNPVPGNYNGCIPYTEGEKAWA